MTVLLRPKRRLATGNLRLRLDPRDAGIGDASPTQGQIAQFRDFCRLARAQAAAGAFGPASGYVEQARGLFVAMGSPIGEKDTLDFALATVYGGSGSVDTAGAGAAGALADSVAGDRNVDAGAANQPGLVSRIFGNVATNPVANAWESAASWTQGLLGIGSPQSGKQKTQMDKGASARKIALPIGAVVLGLVALKALKIL